MDNFRRTLIELINSNIISQNDYDYLTLHMELEDNNNQTSHFNTVQRISKDRFYDYLVKLKLLFKKKDFYRFLLREIDNGRCRYSIDTALELASYFKSDGNHLLYGVAKTFNLDEKKLTEWINMDVLRAITYKRYIIALYITKNKEISEDLLYLDETFE